VDVHSWPSAVVRDVSLSHQVTGSKQPLHICKGRFASVYPFPRPPPPPRSCESLRVGACVLEIVAVLHGRRGTRTPSLGRLCLRVERARQGSGCEQYPRMNNTCFRGSLAR
jgi:hypothetical protein